jgi:hypothetical protein
MVAHFTLSSDLNVKVTQPLSPLQQRLLEGLTLLPEDISLCLSDGNKVPLGAKWQEKPLTKTQVADAIVNGITLRNAKGKEYHLKASKIKGYGIVTGTILTVNDERYYVMALDNDGPSAKVKVTEISGGLGLPKTVSFTSKREGRFQSLFLIPEAFAPSIQTKKIITQPKTETQELEQLEFRWSGLQSVLPPSVHPLTGEYVFVEGCAFREIEIAIAPDWVIEQMLTDNATPTPTLTVATPPKPSTTTQRKNQWTKRDWALSFLKALSSSRGDSYQDWLTVGMALHSIGDDSLLYDWDAWSRNSTKYKAGECDKKWASFGKRSGITLATLGLMAKNDGWQSPFEKPSGRNYTGGIGSSSGGSGGKGNNRCGTGGTGGNGDGGDGGDDNDQVVKFPTFYSLSDTELDTELEKLIAQSLPESKITSIINRLALESLRSPIEVRKQYLERLTEAQFEIERQDNYEWVVNLGRIAEEDLSLSDYLPPGLTDPLTQWCQWLNINQSVVLTALLTATSSLHAVGTELVLHRGYNFRVIATLFSAILADSGQKKSPVFNNIIRDPLQVLRQEKVDAYLAEMENHKAEVLAWKKTPKESRGGEPEPPPPPRLYHFDDATGEAIAIQAAKDPSKALFGLIDELSGFFDSRNAYKKSGKGSDRQDI